MLNLASKSWISAQQIALCHCFLSEIESVNTWQAPCEQNHSSELCSFHSSIVRWQKYFHLLL
jgi:hypothetical protein